MMNRNTLVITLTAALVAAVSLGTTAKDGAKPFALFYQSDTRGYYRPCG
jgi:hypothetical protein